MSKSMNRVRTALATAGLAADILEMPDSTRTASEAAAAAGCMLDQIVKSIIFQGEVSGEIVLFMTAGGNRVDLDRAARSAREALLRADPQVVRDRTGFAIGGVAPLGHLTPVRGFFDPRLLDFDAVWAAAGTPRHIFRAAPHALLRATGATLCDFAANN